MLQGSEVNFLELGVNPTRTGILDVLTMAGAEPRYEREWVELGEPVANVGIESSKELVASRSRRPRSRLIDEIPVLCVLATQCEGTSVIRDAMELG